MTYGKIIPNLEIDGVPAPYGVVNEREIRAASGITFVLGFFALLTLVYERNLTLVFWVVFLFWMDFILKVFIGPHASIFGALGRMLTYNQKPEYVGAIQKRFAWSIGLVISTIVLSFVTYQNFLAPFCTGGDAVVLPCFFPMILCGICLIFMWLESAVGFCVGCTIYSYLVEKGILKRQLYNPTCPGGVCAVKKN